MPTVNFKPRVIYQNPKKLDRSKYPKFKVPKGVEVRMPTLVDASKMQKLSPLKTVGAVAGLTTATFSMHFADIKKQWKQVRTQAPKPMWVFQGGDLYLDVKITVYVAQGFETQKKAFATIMEHELLHVEDEISVVKSYLPKEMLNDTYVKSHLIQGSSVADKTFDHWYTSGHLEDWIRMGLWAPQHNALAAKRDSGKHWEDFRKKIDKLQRS